ncbi:MAG: cytochrome c family protein, partial [Sphingobium sp.]
MKQPIVILAAIMALASPQTGFAAGDAATGQKLFLQCRACHSVQEGAPSGVGPNLSGVVGSKAASQVKYSYSPAMAKSGIVWTTDSLNQFLTRPSALVPGTRMAFAGVVAQKGRDDIIAYLATLK